MARSLSPFLMFTGRAGDALDLYTSLFEDASIDAIERYGAGEQCAEGAVKLARFRLQGQSLVCIDSPDVHAFSFTPSISLFVDCESAEEVDRLCAGLSEGGATLMPLDEYPFAKRYAWITDRFGVSWQLSFTA